MNADLLPELKKLGLSEKEGKIFLAALTLGSGPLSAIARRAGIKRPTVHYLMPRLLERELVTKIPRKKRVYYAAVPPANFMRLLREQQHTLNSLLPSLEAIFRSRPTQPTVRLYEGKEGLEDVYREFFSTHKTLYSVISPEFSVFNETEVSGFLKLLRDSGGRIFELIHRIPGSGDERYISAPWRKGVSQARSLPEDVDFTVDIIASEEKVAFFSLHTLVAVVVDDPDIARSQKSIIQFIWKNRTSRANK